MSESREDLGRISMAGTIEHKRYAFEDGPRTLGQFAIVYLLDGEGFFENEDGDCSSVVPGSVVVLVPGLPHRYGPNTPGRWSEAYLVFEGTLFDCWREEGLLATSRVVGPLLPVEHWRGELEAIIEMAEGDGDPLIPACRLQAILAEALADETGYTVSDDRLFRERVAGMIERELRYDLDLHRVAEAVGMGYESFRKRFRARFGRSPQRYLAAQVMRRASMRLRDPSTLDKEIAAELGFSDEHYFSRRFRQIAGMSPTEYRRAHGQPR